MDYKFSKICIVVSDFYKKMSDDLLDNCFNQLKEQGIDHIKILRVPGCLELPYAIKKVIDKDMFNAVIALGIVIKGETYHFECVSNETVRGITELNLLGDIPVVAGILTCNTKEQAEERIYEKNKGKEFAKTALKMLEINKTY